MFYDMFNVITILSHVLFIIFLIIIHTIIHNNSNISIKYLIEKIKLNLVESGRLVECKHRQLTSCCVHFVGMK